MSSFFTLRSLGCTAGLLLSLATAQAQDHASHHAPAATASSPAPAAATDPALTEGVITRVDARSGKLTIRHGEIANLGMPPMTMVFGLKDPALAQALQPGTKLVFRVEDTGGGNLLITHIEAVTQ